ncbi:MAG TPA: hypothetical protein VKB84_20870 [Candidatus Binataceae bacterium]|jgi:hypothetical protein|nr:hypothetical protein [Candidatus Binataceae bacterium]
MMPKITIEVSSGVATVRTKNLRLPVSRGGTRAIVVEIRDYDIEGGAHDKDVVKRGYSREITEIPFTYR